SKESVIRRYDHEVKGKTVLKPLMGPGGVAPQDAAVMRIDLESHAGVAISNGILPRYGDIDAYQMSAGAFDEAIRQIISVGGKLPDPENPENRFWSVNDNFCVPDSAYDERMNPDGKYKLAQLVRMCEALYDSSTHFNIPMTSGKDSMKNDFVGDGVKISVPPTILYSVVAKIDDIRSIVTAEFKKEGDLIYQIGKTYNELGASEFYHLFDEIGANVPMVRREDALRIYRKIMQANDRKLIRSCHDLSDGGLAVALAESAFGGNYGLDVDVSHDDLDANATLFAESHSRFIVSVSPQHQQDFEELFGADCSLLGKVISDRDIRIRWAGAELINLPVQKVLDAWRGGLQF
ncbi:phosphoribosylformylglycinamidine synthase, partial [candidate division KSB1 bacterium]|nr:phosphoribosylformylglycinamidine synthase [candidate division KSB1 bacterium]